MSFLHYKPLPHKKPRKHHKPKPVLSRRERAAQIAKKYIGVPYRWGGNTPSGLDCSGLVQLAMGKVGIKLPHYTGSQMALGTHIRSDRIRAGDVVFFYSGSHEALATSHSAMIEAPHSGAFVRIREIETWKVYAVRRFS